MTTDPAHSVVVEECAELRRSLDVGLARTEGKLALLAQRDEQSDKDLTELAARVTVLEHARWPLPAVATLCSLAAMAIAFWQVFRR